jgi:hypothetical protein
VCDKDLAGGKCYLKKATVVTVSADGTCQVQVDGGHMLEVR